MTRTEAGQKVAERLGFKLDVIEKVFSGHPSGRIGVEANPLEINLWNFCVDAELREEEQVSWRNGMEETFRLYQVENTKLSERVRELEKCGSCGTPLSSDCPYCQELRSS